MTVNKKIMLRVEKVLVEYPAARDNDSKLVACIWEKEFMDSDFKIEYVFDRIHDDFFTSFESIRRCRQKLQEHNPFLRGEKYKVRQKHTVKVKKELREIKSFASGKEHLNETTK